MKVKNILFPMLTVMIWLSVISMIFSSCEKKQEYTDESESEITTTENNTSEESTMEINETGKVTIDKKNDKSYFFGIVPAESYTIPESEWNDFKELGIKSLRIHLQNGRSKSSYDKVIERAVKEGIEVMMLVSYETYASHGEAFDKGWGPILHYSDYMKLIDELEWAVPYFSERGVTSWEIWNEENGTWHLHPEEYAELITTVYEKFKYTDKWDETATVVMGGLDSVNINFPEGVNGSAQEWITKFYKSKPYTEFKEKYGHSPFDAVGIHPYNTIDTDKNNEENYNVFNSAIEGTLTKTMDKNGDENIPVWITELGDQNSNDAKNAAILKLYMQTAYNNPRIKRFHWFKYTFVGSNYSIVRENGRKRQSFEAYKDVIQELNK